MHVVIDDFVTRMNGSFMLIVLGAATSRAAMMAVLLRANPDTDFIGA